MRFTALAFFVALGLPVGAQTFAPGYVVVQGDTLRGEVDIGTEADAARGVRFREADGSPEVTFLVGEADAFGAVAGRRYRAGQYRVRAVPDPTADTPDVRAGFARVVRDGAADLLAFESVDGRPIYFLDVGASEPIGLYTVDRGASRPLFRQTLLQSLSACSGTEVGDRTPRYYVDLAYTERALAGAVDAYNLCVDPAYAPRTAGRGRQGRRVDFEASLGVVAGTFSRRIPVSFAPDYEDPDAAGVEAGVGALFAPSDWLRLRIGLTYTHDLMRANRFAEPGPVLQVSPLHLDLGLRGVARLGGTAVAAGVGLLIGTTILRDLGDDPDPAARDDLFLYFRTIDLRSSGGTYAEVSATPAGLPVGLRGRVQRTDFATERFFVPFYEESFYHITAVSVAATYGF